MAPLRVELYSTLTILTMTILAWRRSVLERAARVAPQLATLAYSPTLLLSPRHAEAPLVVAVVLKVSPHPPTLC